MGDVRDVHDAQGAPTAGLGRGTAGKGPAVGEAAAEGAASSFAPTGRALAALYLERARREAGELARAGFLLAGSAFADVLLVKGEPGPAELAGGDLLSGPDGAALRAALARLGYPDDAWGACSSFAGTPSGDPADGVPGAPAEGVVGGFRPAAPADVAWAVEVFDPELVVALDAPAARALQDAWGLEAPLVEGSPAVVRGRRVLALGGFEASLSDAHAKQVMWARLKLVPPLGAPL